MTRSSPRPLLVLAAVAVLGATLGLDSPIHAQAASGSSSTPTADQLWKILAGEAKDPCDKGQKPYTEWRFMPERNPQGSLLKFPVSVGEQPHGAWVGVYVNACAFDSIKGYDPTKKFVAKPYSILVKENYPGSHKPPDLSEPIETRNKNGLLSRTVMWKVPGYNQGGPAKTELVNPGAMKGNPAPEAYLVGGDWFWAMFTSAYPGTVVTLATQGFFTKPPSNRGVFDSFIGETQTGKSWFCLSCHHHATGVGQRKYQSYGDWVWRLVPFEVDPPPAKD